DGIRDDLVTGVQTCALPISRGDAVGGDPRQPVGEDAAKGGANGYDKGKQVKGRKRHLVVDTLGLILAVVVHCAGIQDRDGARLRSEERRVGKECRSGWSGAA